MLAFYFTVISESVKQKEMPSEKTKNLVHTLELRRNSDTLVCTRMTLQVTKGKCLLWGLCLKKDLSPLGFQVTAGIYLKPSETSPFARIRDSQRTPLRESAPPSHCHRGHRAFQVTPHLRIS